MTKCIGCGTVLQNENIDNPGYVPALKENVKYCARCFKIIHYNKHENEFVPADTLQIVKKINKINGLTFFLVDFLSFTSEVIETFKKISEPKVLVISKSDILPKGINAIRICHWIKESYNIDNEIVYFSTKEQNNQKFLESKLAKYRCDTAVICGYTNAGKSSFINYILGNKNITTSSVPNTTLDFIRIDMPSYLIIDCPGFSYKSLATTDLKKQAMFVPTARLKPITYQVKEGQTYFIGDIGVIATLGKNSFTFYFSNAITIKREYTKDKCNLVKISVSKNSDLVIKTAGFINIKNACDLLVSETLKDQIEIRNSLFESRDKDE